MIPIRFNCETIGFNNYRCFQEREFFLNNQMNVFVGKNASGKTTILDGLCVILSSYLLAYEKIIPKRYGVPISGNDVFLRQRKDVSKDKDVLMAPSLPVYPARIKSNVIFDSNGLEALDAIERIPENKKGFIFKNKSIKKVVLERILMKEGSRTRFDGANPLLSMVKKIEWALTKDDECEKDIILPIILYLSSARLWNEDNKTQKENSVTKQRWNAYDRCLDKKRGISFCFSYIKKLDNVSKEENRAPFPVYEVIINAINDAMRGELPDSDHIVYSSRYDELVQQKPDGTLIPFSSLSDGYRNVIKIVVDIVTRMCILNPYLKKDVLKETPGVVLIDELDLSLHPNWQKSIVAILKNLFPKVQFVCTTHSPFIIQSLSKGELINLDSSDGLKFSGRSIEDIADEVMGVDDVKWSKAKKKLHDDALIFFEDMKKLVPDDTKGQQRLLEKLELLKGEYADDPAFLAFLEIKYDSKIQEIKKNASG